MVNSETFASMNLDLLAEQCNGETKKYFRGVAYESRYCFELLCRACRDQLEAALSHMYAIYLTMLAARARRHPQFYRSCQDADSFARTALANFYHAVKGEKFLQKFSTLAQAIAYMYTCVHTVVLEDVEHSLLSEWEPSEDISSPAPPAELELEELWAHICRLLPHEDDQRLAYLRFVLEMKPAEIAQRYPQTWESARRVSVDLQTIRRSLRADEYLRGLAGLADEEADTETDDQPADDDEQNSMPV